MWRLVFLNYCLCELSRATTWYPVGVPRPLLGEQLDLLTLGNSTPSTFWTEPDDDEDDDDEELAVALPGVDATARPIDSPTSLSTHDDPGDDVERVEPRETRQWPSDVDTAPTWPRSSPGTEQPAPRRATFPTTSAQRNSSTQRYPVVTAPPPTATMDEAFCDFGALPTPTLCEWQNGNGGLEWKAGTGTGTNWLGGPPSDATTGAMDGGYAFVETSELPAKDARVKSSGGLLHSPQLGSTGVSGTCFTFKYAMDGLSAAGLRVLLHIGADPYSVKKERPEEIPLEGGNVTTTCLPTTGDLTEERVLWHAQYYILGTWQQAQILYTYPGLHSLIIEAVPVDAADPSRLYRGHIAIDDIDLQPGSSCIGFCNFAGGFCDWNNDAEDDFDWTISRGSVNPTTGPAMDSSSERSTAGGYAYIDSTYPRRPGDAARLISVGFPATGPDAPACLHFSFHMFGSGVGALALYVRHFRTLEARLEEIWRLAGNAGNAWFASEVTVSSIDDYQLVFEATVGDTAMGDIAVDDVMFTPGVCPTSPQVAAPISRDCTFEVDECEWINSRDPDRVEWERVSTQILSPRNQRKPYSNGFTVNRRNEYFLNLGRPRGASRTPTGGTAQLVSREMRGTDEPLCLTFWYFMFEPFIDSTGPSLGVLRVSIQPVGETTVRSRPIWQLYNNQGPTWNYAQTNINERKNFNIVIEGTWGPNRASGNIGIDDIAFFAGNCTVRPPSATVRPEDCSFEKDLCGWENITTPDNDRAITWQRAYPNHRPAQLVDKTFGASGDFVFFDIFTNDKKSADVRLRSPIIDVSPDEEAVCFVFWFAAFGVEESTALQVIKVPARDNGDANGDDNGNGNSDTETLWSLTAKGFNNPRPAWTPAQVTVDARVPYRLVLKGSASNGGFAVDDVMFQPQNCPTRPPTAQPTSNRI